MPILITGARLTLEKLMGQLLTSRASDSQRNAALRALQDANPGLTGRLEQGTAVVLPDLPHRRIKLDHVGTIAGAGRLDDILVVLTPLPADLTDRATTVKARLAALRQAQKLAPDVIGDAQLKKFLTPTRAAAAGDRAKAESDAAEALATALSAAAPRWAEQLDALKALLLRAG